MIRSFTDRHTRDLFEGDCPRKWLMIRTAAERKLAMLDAAASLDFLRVPPGNRLERLRGDREGQWSIRINNRWRICFRWHENEPWNVEIVDYH